MRPRVTGAFSVAPFNDGFRRGPQLQHLLTAVWIRHATILLTIVQLWVQQLTAGNKNETRGRSRPPCVSNEVLSVYIGSELSWTPHIINQMRHVTELSRSALTNNGQEKGCVCLLLSYIVRLNRTQRTEINHISHRSGWAGFSRLIYEVVLL